MRPKISVIMAAYKSERFIASAIRSIKYQNFKEFELIIALDKSSDNTEKIIRRFMRYDKRIRLTVSSKKVGRALARNRALDKARGKYIAIIDSDDIAVYNRLEIQVKFLEANPDVFMCGGGSYVISDPERYRLGTKRAVKKVDKVLPYFNPFNTSTVMHRKSKHRYREKIVLEDYDMWLRFFTAGKKLVNLDDILVSWRIHKDWKIDPTFYESGLKVREFYRERVATGADSYDSFDPKTIKPKVQSYTSNGFLSKVKFWVWSKPYLRTAIYDVEARFPEITVQFVKMVEGRK